MSRESLPPAVRAALEAGNKIEAIKALRAATGLGLKEAKDWIDAHERGGVVGMLPFDRTAAAKPDSTFELSKQVPNSGAGSAPPPLRRPGLAPGQVDSGAGGTGKWFAMIAVAILAVVVATYW